MAEASIPDEDSGHILLRLNQCDPIRQKASAGLVQAAAEDTGEKQRTEWSLPEIAILFLEEGCSGLNKI